jgi:predicted RND superfamily exporter protein
MGGRNPTVSLMILTTAIVGTVLVVWIYEKVWTFVPEWTVFLAIYFAFGMGAGLGLGATM